MVKNEDIIKNFIRGLEKGRTQNLFISENVLYSYGYHFPISLRVKDGDGFKFVSNLSKYSQTTSTIQNKFKYFADNKILTSLNTNDLKSIIEDNPRTIDDLNKCLILRNLNTIK